jgi:hypothetical protein
MSGDYKVTFLTIKNDYETRCVTDTMSDSGSLDAQLERLDIANNRRTTTTTEEDPRPDFCFVDSDKSKPLKGNDKELAGNKQSVPPHLKGLQWYSESECKSFGDGIREGWGGCLRSGQEWTKSYSYVCRQDAGLTERKIVSIPYNNTADINAAFAPIAQYYANLQSIKERLQDLLDETSKEISSGQGVLMNEERYSHSIHPERAIKAREATNGFIPELKTQTIPILISIGAAMLAFSIVLSFQMMGVYGQFTLSPAYSQAYATFQATVASITNNTSVVGGFAGVSLLIALYFAYLFYSSQPRD